MLIVHKILYNAGSLVDKNLKNQGQEHRPMSVGLMELVLHQGIKSSRKGIFWDKNKTAGPDNQGNYILNMNSDLVNG